jgi:hypothetical protein
MALSRIGTSRGRRGKLGWHSGWRIDADVRVRRECFCNEQFNVKSCSVQGIYKTADVLAHDPASVLCANPINLLSKYSVAPK